MLSLDEALSELGMLNTDNRCRREYIQDIEAKFERRKAENANWIKWQQKADIVREDNTEHLPPFNYNQSADNRMSSNLMSESGMPSNNDYPKQLSGMPSNGATSIVVNLPSGEMNGDGGDFTRIMQQQNSNPANGVITDPANSSRNNSISIQINQGPTPFIHRDPMPPHPRVTQPGPLQMRFPPSAPYPALRGVTSSPSITRDSQFVTNITIQNQRFYPKYKLEQDSFNRRMQFSPRRIWSQQHRHQYSSPYPLISLPSSLPSSCTSVVQPYHCYPSSVLKLSGVLTSFKHRTFRTRARVRFCLHEENNADDLTAQLANIKLDTSSFTKLNTKGIKSPPPPTLNSSPTAPCGLSLTPPPSTSNYCTTTTSGALIGRRDSTPTSQVDELDEFSCRRLILEPRSRHMSLEPNDPFIKSDLLATSLNNLDLDESSN